LTIAGSTGVTLGAGVVVAGAAVHEIDHIHAFTQGRRQLVVESEPHVEHAMHKHMTLE